MFWNTIEYKQDTNGIRLDTILRENDTPLLQVVTSCKQTIYKQTGWRGAPELSNGAGWRQRAQAMAAKQCRLRAAGGKKF